jgi:hypothetical protein
MFGYSLSIAYNKDIVVYSFMSSLMPNKVTALIKYIFLNPYLYIKLICIALIITMFFAKNWARITFTFCNALCLLLIFISQIRDYHFFSSHHVFSDSFAFAKEFLNNLIIYDAILLAALLLFTLPLYTKRANQYFKATAKN